jgi:hypothetical protein
LQISHKNITYYWILNGLSFVLRMGFGGCETYIYILSVRNNSRIVVVNYLGRGKLEERFVSVSVVCTFEIYL